MKLRLMKLAIALSVPLFFSACGGIDDLFGSDGGVDAGVCPGVPTLFAVPSGTYKITGVKNLSDTCQTGVKESDFEGQMRLITNNTQTGTITVAGAAGNPNPLGEGAVRCNEGTLAFGPKVIQDAVSGCQFTQTRSSKFTVTARGAFTMNYSEQRTMPNNKCMPMTDCGVSFTATFTLQ